MSVCRIGKPEELERHHTTTREQIETTRRALHAEAARRGLRFQDVLRERIGGFENTGHGRSPVQRRTRATYGQRR